MVELSTGKFECFCTSFNVKFESLASKPLPGKVPFLKGNTSDLILLDSFIHLNFS